jgi:hypothetical protein
MRKVKTRIEKKFIHYPDELIFAICYTSYRIIYYNLSFNGSTKSIIFV